MLSVFSLLHACLQAFIKLEMNFSGAEVAKIIITEHIRTIYRMLSTGNTGCYLAVMLTLIDMAKVSGPILTLLLASLDWSHKGFAQVARMRKSVTLSSIGEANSPRELYIALVLAILNGCQYEERIIISKTALPIIHQLLDGIATDSQETIINILATLQHKIVHNEGGNRNLPVTMLRKHFNGTLQNLLTAKSAQVADSARNFFFETAGTAGSGISFPVDPANLGTLKNKVIFDFVQALNIVQEEDHLELAMSLMKANPDVAWAMLAGGRGMHLDPSDNSFTPSAVLSIKLFGIISEYYSEQPTVPREFVPKSITRQSLSRGILHDDLMIRFYSMLLILAVFKSISCESYSGSMSSKLAKGLPDSRTVYNAWRQTSKGYGAMEDSPVEWEMLENTFLLLLSYYLDIDPSIGEMIKATDLWPVESRDNVGVDLADAAQKLASKLDASRLLRSVQDLTVVKRLLSMETPSRAELLYIWLFEMDLCPQDLAKRLSYTKNIDTINSLLDAIYEIFTEPLVFRQDGGKYALLLWCKQKERNLIVPEPPTVPEHNDSTTMAMDNDAFISHPAVEERIDVSAIVEHVDRSSVLTFVTSALSMVNRASVLISYRSVLVEADDSASVDLNLDMVELLRRLFVDYDHRYWISMLCALFTRPREEFEGLDLRLFLDSGILGYAIIGLSSANSEIFKASHLILRNYRDLLSVSRLKERNQVALIVTALAGHFALPTPHEVTLPRFQAFLYAHSIMVMLRPEHALYRSILEIFLAVQHPTVMDFFTRIFPDANEEIWLRQCHWLLHVLDEALDEHVHQCDIDEFKLVNNVSTLLLTSTLDTTLRKTCISILQKVLSSPSQSPNYSWLPIFLTNVVAKQLQGGN